jgi:hypothetical protein
LQERHILRLEQDQIVGLEIERGAETLRYERQGPHFVRTAPPGGQEAGEAAEMFLYDLLDLRWEQRAPGGKPLDLSGAMIKVSLAPAAGQAQGQSKVLTLGPLQGEGLLAARVEGDSQAYMVQRAFVDRLPSLQGQAAGQ